MMSRFVEMQSAEKQTGREEYAKQHPPSMFFAPKKLKPKVSAVFSRNEPHFHSKNDLVDGLDEKTAKAFLAAQLVMKKLKEKKDSKKIKLIDYHTIISSSSSVKPKKDPPKKCASHNMSGKPCPFSATQGKYCKRHKVTETDIF